MAMTCPKCRERAFRQIGPGMEGSGGAYQCGRCGYEGSGYEAPISEWPQVRLGPSGRAGRRAQRRLKLAPQGKVEVVPATSMRHALKSVRSAIWTLYEWNAAGCCLHVVIDDRNFDDASIRHALELANQRRHAVCAYVAQFFLDAPRAQRRKIPRPRAAPPSGAGSGASGGADGGRIVAGGDVVGDVVGARGAGQAGEQEKGEGECFHTARLETRRDKCI
jgi:hypothetical protein